MTDTLADVLGEYMQKAHTSANRLAKLSKVPAQTIKNWLNRRVTKPHQWQGLVKVAAALHLSELETSRLLQAGGHPILSKLRAAATAKSDLDLLSPFQSPFQAIADLPTFVGREPQLAELKRMLLDGGQAVICGLRGMGGVGKTSLAAHLARHLRDYFPDGVLWARLDTSDALSILGAFADAFGKDVSQHRDVDSRAGIVRSLLADKRALIVLDNAETSAQVRPLLPPSTGTCAVLITTRHDLAALDGWTRFTLDPFPPGSGESLKLFEQFLGPGRVTRHKDSLMEIADLLGHLPLAIAIAAGRLAATDGAADAIPNLLAQLRRADSRLSELVREDRSVRLSFDVTYEALSPEQQTFFAALGVFGGDDFGVEAAAYVTASTVETAELALKTLCGLSLIQESCADRYRLHPLLRDYAREWLAALEGEEAQARMIEFYVQAVERVDNSLYNPLKPDLSNILFALETARARRLPSLFIRGTVASTRMLFHLGLYSTLATHLCYALDFARQLNDLAGEGWVLFHLGHLESETGERLRGEAYVRDALALARQQKAPDLICECLMRLAIAAWYNGDKATARQYFAECEPLARQFGLRRILARLTGNTALDALEEGRYAEAQAGFHECLHLARAEGLTEIVILTTLHLGTLANRQGQHAEADVYFQESIALARQTYGRKPFDYVQMQGVNALERGKLDEAGLHLDEALTLVRESGHLRGLSAVLRDRGDLYLTRA